MKRRAGLIPFLFVSLAAHGAVLWSSSRALMSLPARLADGGSALQVELVGSSVVGTTTMAAARPPSKAIAHTENRNPASFAPSFAEVATSTPEVATHPEAVAASTATVDANPSDATAAAARVRAAIDKTLANYFFYPERARERGWEGRVLLAFRVQTDGRLDQVRVERSCGYALLDRAAVTALRQVARIDTVVTGLRGALDVHLPVVYRLEN